LGAEEHASRASFPDVASWEKGAPERVTGSRLSAVREHRYLLR
jgi:hypothetical protein